MKLKTLLELAEHHCKYNDVRAQRKFADAQELKSTGDFVAARRCAMQSLELSVGRDHVDYQKAACAKGDKA